MPMKRRPSSSRAPRRFDIHLHLPSELVARVSAQLEDILTHIRELRSQGARILMVNQQTKDALARIEKATTDLGTRVTALIAKIGTGMSDADVSEVNTELGAIAGNLEGMAKDPENPIPVEG